MQTVEKKSLGLAGREETGRAWSGVGEAGSIDARAFSGSSESQIVSEENPVRRGLVSRPEAYAFTSAGRGFSDPMPVHMQSGGNKTRA
jgi:hypothetical protein